MIIGTAGHIDHGKTALVRALTGVDTDRLPEEKARGISIELSYAYLPVPDTQEVLGFIDVPGHEKFVHTMAAGAVGIDHALLVIAADDGPMPQTREHLAILELLGVRQGCVALNKADRASPAQLAAVQAEVAALLQGTPLAGAPVFATNALDAADAGLAALRAHLLDAAQRFPARPSQGLFRLAVDRSFTLPGQGTIVTGTVFGGSVRVGDVLRHSPSGQSVRVRSIHAQNQPAQAGHSGQRVALNLAGIERTAIARGDWMAQPQALQATRRLDVQLRVLASQAQPINPSGQTEASAAKPIGPWASVHLHLGTAHRTAHVVPLEGSHIACGQQAHAQLVLDEEVFVTAGDRFILRNAQASQTIAGGQVLDPNAPERKRRSPERMAWLDAVQTAIDTGDIAPLIEQAPWGMGRAQLARLLGQPARSLPAPPGCIALGADEAEQLLLAPQHWAALQAKVCEALARFHERTPDEPGVNAARLRRMALPNLPPAALQSPDTLWCGLLAALLEQGQLAQTGPWLHLPSHRVQLSAQEEERAARLLPAIAAGRFDPPWVRDLALAHHLPEEEVRQLLRKLARQGRLHQVVKDLFYSPEAIDALLAIAAELARQSPQQAVQARHFRDATALGRKRAIQVLEYFDRSGHTRRIRDAHVMRT
ncbi:selenocysteine-specific translation elongation factor [Vandammella animalimorsus]|uniref:selenocysteine-specific translation elongation factor n=1 Tax=Vandammella animalimorsus TaxID=2029117 RepID=UPI0031BB41C7